jgi:hypothetical protein
MIACTALAAALVAAGPSPSLLDGCTARPADIGWSYRCDGLYAAAKDDPRPPADLRAFLESLERSFQERDDAEPTRQGWERRRLAGQDVDVLLADYPSQHDVLTGARRAEGTRVVFCRARKQERCLAVVDALMAAAWKAGPLPGAKVEGQATGPAAGAAGRSGPAARFEKVRRHEPLARAELSDASPLELRILRNAVFAARGQSFKSPELEAFFSAFSWYAPKVAAVPESGLDPADKANLELLRAAEGERGAGAAAPQWDLLLLLLQLDAGRRPSAEETALVGTWTEYVSAASEDALLVRPHYDVFPSGWVTRRWEDCRGGRLVVLGAWEASGAKLAVRWFAEVRTAGGKAVSRGPDRCPEWEEAPASKLLPVHEQATIAVSAAKRNERGRPERTFDGKEMVKDEDLPRPEQFEVEAMRP